MKRTYVIFRADGRREMVTATPSTSAERQRDFQRAHPGYDRLRKAKQRARLKRVGLEFLERERAEALAAQAAAVEAAAVLRLPLPTWRLALPAPVECPAMMAMNELSKRLKAERVPAAERVRAA